MNTRDLAPHQRPEASPLTSLLWAVLAVSLAGNTVYSMAGSNWIVHTALGVVALAAGAVLIMRRRARS